MKLILAICCALAILQGMRAEECGENEEYNECGTSCQDSCLEQQPRVCNTMCNQGCFCKQGFVRLTRDAASPCVEMKSC